MANVSAFGHPDCEFREHKLNKPDRSTNESDGMPRTLRIAFAAAPAPHSPLMSHGGLDAEQEAKWRCAQRAAPQGSVAAIDIACLLAYHGVESAMNTERVLSASRRSDDASRSIEPGCRTIAAGHLARLYDRRHGASVLVGLLDGELDEKARREALAALWDRHWPALLRASSESEQRRRRVAQALQYVRELFPGDGVFRPYLRYLKRGMLSRDRRLRLTSAQIMALFKSAINKPRPRIRPPRA